MKKYLLMVLLAGLSLQAENNPFDLEKNLQKIDQDQDVLLSALKEMSGKKEAKGQVEIAKVEENESVVPEPNSAEVSQAQEAKSAKHEADAKAAEMAQLKQEEQAKIVAEKKKQKAEAQRIVLEKKNNEIKKQEALVLKAKEEEKKREEERLEVEAYEAQKMMKQKMKKELQHEAIAKIDIKQEKRMQKREADRAYIKAITEVDAEN